MERYRSILICSIIAKHHHRFLRSRLFKFVKAAFLASQCGGMPGKGTGLAAHVARSFVEATATTDPDTGKCLSGLICFIDLRIGFYTIIRELAMRLASDPEEIDAVLESIEIPGAASTR